MSQSAAVDFREGEAGGESVVVTLARRFDIWPDAPLAQLNTPSASAVVARDRLNPDRAIYALVCDPEIPPRLGVLGKLKELPLQGLVRLLEWGVVYWPENHEHRFVMVYERPSGPRLVSGYEIQYPEIEEREIIDRVMTSVVQTLRDIAKLRMAHRNIRPSNMFLRDSGRGTVMLGECGSVPAGFDQPPAFETIESLMASPEARGGGTIADDIYALGVSVLALCMRADPAAGRDTETLLAQKMERGSFAALIGRARPDPSLRECLRGMLEDNAAHRWDLDDLRAWLSERRRRGGPMPGFDRAERPFSFNGSPYYTARQLGDAFALNWDHVSLQEGGHEVLKWARNSLHDDVIADHVLTAIEVSRRQKGGSGNSGADAGFIARLCSALDPVAPIRYKGVSTHIDGLGPLLAMQYADHGVQQVLAAVFADELPGFQIKVERSQDTNATSLARSFSRFAKFVKSPLMGQGLERCLYELNKVQYCRSSLIRDQKVMRIGDLLPALEKAAAKNPAGPPFDRHIAAFAATHLSVSLDKMLEAASEGTGSQNGALGMLGVLAAIQAHTRGECYPRLAHWLGKHLNPLISTFRHRIWREKVETELPGVIDTGNIVAIFTYLSNGDARKRDQMGYNAAKAEFTRLNTEAAFLRSHGINDPGRARDYGQRLALNLCSVVGLAVIALTVFYMM